MFTRIISFINKNDIPQGSILGPLLFLLYINDIANISKKIFFLIFADDTNIFVSGKDINILAETVNVEFEKLMIWLHANKLSLNINKTNYIIFGLRKKILSPVDVCINNVIVKRVSYTKCLGIVIDEKLSWYHHIQYKKENSKRDWNTL